MPVRRSSRRSVRPVRRSSRRSLPTCTSLLTPLHANGLGLSLGSRHSTAGVAARPNAAANPMRKAAFRREIVSALMIAFMQTFLTG